ncbi:GntR family transcriptional regulator [Rhodococcus sp. NCIMB 12038]|uniref:GntR family transcriptional regulator n=1 Tax=Rhodococcus sp. NCIMB 12038 TaxID=933800 RepID=UPI000B3C22AD|nr:GntR family transcriptional regulator [Rhodococcus sp. NCIMB 12038]OUS79655.1 hypothetical protein CA951_42510 [Rhodococcus sp. NCIMB 12038]
MAISDIPPPVFTDRRQTSLVVHRHIRDLIINNVLPPGTRLKQAELARQFGISRAPIREAFRMLQEEGLIDADLNYAAQVRMFDAEGLDQLYGARIALESLGVRISTGRLDENDNATAHAALSRMRWCRESGDMESWAQAHRDFHSACMSKVVNPVARTVRSYAERSERYVRLYQRWFPESFTTADREHEQILSAVLGTDPDVSAELIANHLARTARAVLSRLAPDSRFPAVEEAVTIFALRDPSGTVVRPQ